MAAEHPVDLVERQNWIEPVAEGLQKAVAGAYQAGGGPGRAIKNFLHGTWLGHPLHPVLTDIPIGAWTAAAVLDAMDTKTRRLSAAADGAIAVGLAGAAGAAVTGLTDWQHTTDEDRRVGLSHGLLNTTAFALYATALAMRRNGSRDAGRVLAGVGFVVSLGAAYIGGHLVYKKRLGVDHAPRPDAWDDFV